MFADQSKNRISEHPEIAASPGGILTANAGRVMAVLRIGIGFIFLWAFLDKTFGLRYSTPSAKAWIHGGSPTKGFLSSVDVGPFQSAFHSMAGTWPVDWLFMLGLLGIGASLILGIAGRIAAVSGIALVAMMWLAEFPLAQHTSTGAASGSTNPFADYHFLYAIVLALLATGYAGNTWGLGRVWARLPIVQKHRWLL
jgi:thiosulfate dehydrogenase [quinone] large subunit